MIREAGIEDLGEIVSLGRKLHSESTFSHWVDYDDASARAHAERLLNDPDSAFFLSLDESKATGFFCGYVRPIFFNNSVTQAIEDNWYVTPEFRRGLHGPLLLKAFMRWAQERGAASMLLSDRAMIEPENVQRMMRAFGFSLDSISYRRDL